MQSSYQEVIQKYQMLVQQRSHIKFFISSYGTLVYQIKLQNFIISIYQFLFQQKKKLIQMLQLLGNKDQNQSDCISVNVFIHLLQANLHLETSNPPDIPFYIFINGFKEQIFAQIPETQYEQTIECYLDKGGLISQYDNRTLQMLGFTNNCTFHMTLKLLGQRINDKNNKRLYKVLAELKNKTIQLFVEQLKTTPVSSVFHDILVELFQNYQLDISLPFVFFINGTEVQPFDIRLIQDFQTKQGIIIKLVLPKKQPNQDSIEKLKFALNKVSRLNVVKEKLL
ncbi:unnamed protein product (macronuclear) [Paramecium tetraurelia]|uniref:Ubiquitin-like domain-containing protein n=1 Tax=Paramecium tetraurelia TaxID=5888 RepID=A0DXJ3_PARTE|nr:uncharacterized protein GSPATT00021384001 [Paramecium tetraurelia]CAK87760.1 unnamed protein product [Paramecium tetraurelia]|eukprot:XP_001455157.1 hypothetical protein (macronuclear) [Paramecium tetraurelia strain d4-2]